MLRFCHNHPYDKRNSAPHFSYINNPDRERGREKSHSHNRSGKVGMKKHTIFTFLAIISVTLSVCSCDNGKREVYAVDNSGNLQSEVTVPKSDDIRPVLSAYIDNTGSMDGYMCVGSQLNDAVYDYLSYLNGNVRSTELFYINNRVIPYKGNLETFVRDLNPDSFRKAGGSRADTDMGQMISDILKNATDSTVSIFISDCILDLPAKNSQYFLTNCQIKVRNAISEYRKNNPGFAVEILKMWSNFEGYYYYPTGGSEKLKDVKRPYYIWLFGDKDILSKLNKNVPLSTLEKYDLAEVLSFVPSASASYTISNDKLTGSVISPMRDKYCVVLRADLGSTLQPEAVIMNTSNYTFNDKSVVLEYIKPITAKGSPYTHTMGVTIPVNANMAESKKLVFSTPTVPAWVSDSNDETGMDIWNNIDKTTGIKNLVMGVAEAYKNEETLTELKFSIRNRKH